MMIGSRVLTIRSADVDAAAAVRLFRPELADDEWICRYEIEWPEGTRRSFAAGIDAIQALHLTLQKIGIDLYTSTYHETGRLIWKERNDGYGFPVPKNARNILIGSDKVFDG